MNFSHLSNPALAAAGGHGAAVSPVQYIEADYVACSRNHSEAHYIATSEQARQNPVLAFRLIKQGVSFETARKRLERSPRTLSHFTDRRMAHICPGWELMTEESQNLEAFGHSMRTGDANGYSAGMKAALLALEKYIEPLTFEDIQQRQG